MATQYRLTVSRHAATIRDHLIAITPSGTTPPGPVREFGLGEAGFVYLDHGRCYKVIVTDITDEVRTPDPEA